MLDYLTEFLKSYILIADKWDQLFVRTKMRKILFHHKNAKVKVTKKISEREKTTPHF